MTKILRAIIIGASIVCFSVALVVDRAQAQSSCLTTDLAKEMLSKAGVPTNEAQLLLLVLIPDSTAEASVDQITQTSPTFANRNATELKTEDKYLEEAQNFLKSTPPLTEDAQNCIGNLQKIRDNIKKDLSQRDKENIPDNLSPNQLRALRDRQADQAKNQRYDPNTMPFGGPPRRTGPGNSGSDTGGQPGGGATCVGTTCVFR